MTYSQILVFHNINLVCFLCSFHGFLLQLLVFNFPLFLYTIAFYFSFYICVANTYISLCACFYILLHFHFYELVYFTRVSKPIVITEFLILVIIATLFKRQNSINNKKVITHYIL